MSNSLAISTVSAAFLRRLLSAANAAVPTATVRLGTPTSKLAEDAKPLVNLHLYRVEPNEAHANSHLPTRNTRGDTRRQSQLALNLHYVISFYGDHDKFEPDLMLGNVMLALEHEPFLSKSTITNAINDNDELDESDLAKAVSRLRVTRELMTLDDFSKVWSIFYQVPYTLSLSYMVSHVILETSEVAPVPAPVAQPGLWVSPVAELRLDQAGSPPGQPLPPTWGGVLHVRGKGLGRPDLTLEVDGAALVMDAVVQTPDSVTIPLTAATFGGTTPRVGIHRIQAIAPPARPDLPDHLRPRSNALAFALNPAITLGAVNAPGGGATATGTVAVNFVPPIGRDQNVRLLLDFRDPSNPAAVVLPGRAPVAGNATDVSLDFAFANLRRGAYLVRADMDGLISPVTLDTTPGSPTLGQIIGPELDL